MRKRQPKFRPIKVRTLLPSLPSGLEFRSEQDAAALAERPRVRKQDLPPKADVVELLFTREGRRRDRSA